MKLETLAACTLTLAAALACSSAPEDPGNQGNQGNQQETFDNKTPVQQMQPGGSTNVTPADIDWVRVAVNTTQGRYSPVEANPPTVIVEVPVYRRPGGPVERVVTHRSVFSGNSPEVEAARAQEDQNQ